MKTYGLLSEPVAWQTGVSLTALTGVAMNARAAPMARKRVGRVKRRAVFVLGVWDIGLKDTSSSETMGCAGQARHEAFLVRAKMLTGPGRKKRREIGEKGWEKGKRGYGRDYSLRRSM